MEVTPGNYDLVRSAKTKKCEWWKFYVVETGSITFNYTDEKSLQMQTIRGYLRDDQQNEFTSKIASVLVTENSTRQCTGDVIFDTGLRRFQ